MGRFPTLLGLVTGLLAALVLGVAVLAPLALTHRDAGAMEKLYGSAMVQVASRFGGGPTANPMANDPDALRMGRAAYTSSCAQCHGAKGDGRGHLGQATFPPATDLTRADTQRLSDGQMFRIVKNGLGFTAMPGYANEYSDRQIWTLVSYVRSLTT